jgi:hypothetical protein
VSFAPADDLFHADAAVEEWVFAAWSPDARVGAVSGHRVVGRRAWYWSALVQEGRPLLHLTEWDVALRADPFVVKAPEMWAEHHCDSPQGQWSIGNEAHAAALDDPDDALGRAYGVPTPMAFDLEWYATGEPVPIAHGYEQPGVVHGIVEVLGRPAIELVEAPGHRWHRWRERPDLAPVELDEAVAHTGLRAAFAFPDGATADWVLTPRGWRRRARRRRPR